MPSALANEPLCVGAASRLGYLALAVFDPGLHHLQCARRSALRVQAKCPPWTFAAGTSSLPRRPLTGREINTVDRERHSR